MKFVLALMSISMLSTMVTAGASGSQVFKDNTRHACDTTQENDIQKLQDRLKWLYQHLQTYVSEADFNYVGFADGVEETRKHLANIEYGIDTLSSISVELENQLQWTRTVYETMVKIADRMVYYSDSGVQGHMIVFKMMFVKARALVLNNSYGVVDEDNYGHQDESRRLFCTFKNLMEESKMFLYSYSFRQVVGRQARETNQSIEYLRKQIAAVPWTQADCVGG